MSRPISLRVEHNIEIAHRLYNLPGKCRNIHGHSMWVTLTIHATDSDKDGYAIRTYGGEILEFGQLKKVFRSHLDEVYDHHLHLNKEDPFGKVIAVYDPSGGAIQQLLPGLVTWPADPSTENISRWILDFMQKQYVGETMSVSIQETRTNGVETWRS